jgi:nitrogen regulatory protein PII
MQAHDRPRHAAKRVEIIIEAPMESRLTATLERAGVTGFTILPVLGGSGRSGRWSREGQVGRSGMVAVICLIRPERLDALLDAAFEVVERHIGVISITDCTVLRAERF